MAICALTDNVCLALCRKGLFSATPKRRHSRWACSIPTGTHHGILKPIALLHEPRFLHKLLPVPATCSQRYRAARQVARQGARDGYGPERKGVRAGEHMGEAWGRGRWPKGCIETCMSPSQLRLPSIAVGSLLAIRSIALGVPQFQLLGTI